MKKKLIAVAVAGALGAPAVALAQASTVQIYGTFVVNYNYVDQGDSVVAGVRQGRPSVDMLNSHDSNIGFKGQEALGGGLTAWFQCESTANVTGASSYTGDSNWCGRNSGVGLRGNFGNVWFGVWDTPLKMISGPARPFSTSGAYGMGGIMWNEASSDTGNGQLGDSAGERAGFTRRQMNTINYETPGFSGFKANLAYSTTNEATDAVDSSIAAKPRLWSIGATYTNGPLYVGLGYESHSDYNPGNVALGTTAATYSGGDDNGWNFAIAYTFMNAVKVSLIYTSQEFDVSNSTSLDHDAWGLFLDWQIAGPHRIRAEYVDSGDNGGNATVAVGQYQAPLTAAGVAVGGTGGKLYSIQYAYAFSKRTEVNFGYSKIDNDNNARYRLQTMSDAPAAGSNQSAWVLGVKHTF